MKERRIVKGREYVRELTRNLNIRCSDEQLERWREAAGEYETSSWIRWALDQMAKGAAKK